MKIYALLSLILISVFSFSQNKEQTFDQMVKSYYKGTIPLIYPHQLYKKMLSKEKIYILDTREKKEFEVSTIKNAIHVGYEQFSMERVKSINKNAPIIVYCTIGARSENIGEKLKKNGFTNVSNLYGGLIYWKNQNYKVIHANKNTTPNIHVFSKEWGKWLKKGIAVY